MFLHYFLCQFCLFIFPNELGRGSDSPKYSWNDLSVNLERTFMIISFFLCIFDHEWYSFFNSQFPLIPRIINFLGFSRYLIMSTDNNSVSSFDFISVLGLTALVTTSQTKVKQ